jgi:DNA-binding NtrC family response regulator
MADLRVLVLEDYEPDCALIEVTLRRAGMAVEVRLASDEASFLDALENFRPEVILSDYAVPGFTGLDALRFVRDHGLDMPFILITGSQTEETVAECFKFGADDYLLKSSLTRLPAALRHSLQRRRAERERGEAIVRLRDRERRLAEAQAIAHLGSWELGLANLDDLSRNPLWW